MVAVHTDNIGLVPVLLVHHHFSEKWHISSIKPRLGNTTGTACTNLCMLFIGWLLLLVMYGMIFRTYESTTSTG